MAQGNADYGMPADRAELRELLRGFGITPGDFGNLIDAAIRNNWSPEVFVSHVYSSNQFHKMFPGIFRGDGTLLMSPSQYLKMKDQYKHLAAVYGLRGELDDKRIGALIHGNVSVAEFEDRLEAVQRMRQYSTSFEAFNELLRAKGIIKKDMSEEDLFDFIMDRKPISFYNLWEQASVGSAAATYGVDLSAKEMKGIANQLPGRQDEASLQESFSRLAQNIQSVLPLSKIASYGLNRSDLIELEFGGPRQSVIADQVQRILAENDAYEQEQVASGMGSSSNQRAQVF